MVLGIDFGLKRIGLAVADENLAQPLVVVANSLGMIDQILEICQQQKIKKIIIGLPEGRLVKKIKEFSQKLQEITGLPIEFQDETLTSEDALDMMIKIGKKKKAREEKQDAFAAAIILQEYLKRSPKNV